MQKPELKLSKLQRPSPGGRGTHPYMTAKLKSTPQKRLSRQQGCNLDTFQVLFKTRTDRRRFGLWRIARRFGPRIDFLYACGHRWPSARDRSAVDCGRDGPR